MRSKDTEIAAVKPPRCPGGRVKWSRQGTKAARGWFEETQAPSSRELTQHQTAQGSYLVK